MNYNHCLRILRLVIALLFAVILFIGMPSVKVKSQLQTLEGYTGQAEVNVLLTNINGQPIGYQTYNLDNVLVGFFTPLPGETNPFQILILPGSTNLDPGWFGVVSSQLEGDILYQYWTYSYQSLTNKVQGTLTQEGFLLNSLIIPVETQPGQWTPLIFYMAQGTQITGTAYPEFVDVQITGNTPDGKHPFQINIFAEQVVSHKVYLPHIIK